MKQLLKHVTATIITKQILAMGILSVSLAACKKDKVYSEDKPSLPAAASVLSAAGNSAAIIGTINTFRTLLGDSLNTIPGKSNGRREVNWDAVPAAFGNANNFPGDFFNSLVPADPAGRKRGLVMTTAGTGFRVDSSDYAGIDPSYANQFDAFSKKRLLISASSNITVVNFKVPGTATNAIVKGFGVIFSDVDNNSSTTLEFFNGTASLGIFKAPAQPAGGNFSFLGVQFKDVSVTSVIITCGNGILGPGVKTSAIWVTKTW